MQTKKKKRMVLRIVIVTVCILCLLTVNAFAADNMWDVAKKLLDDIYKKLAALSTILAVVISSVAVIGAKLSNNQQKVNQAWDWLKRVWIAWAIINGIGAFIT